MATWKVPATNNDWIGEKIIKQSDDQLLAMAEAHFRGLTGKNPEPAPSPTPAEDIPVDPAAEQAAFAELLKFVADNPEDDCEFTALTADEFAAETFTPPVSEPEAP